MAWNKVNVSVGKTKVVADMNGTDLEMPNVVELGDSINIDGKPYQVSSFEVDERDDRLKIKLAMASSKKEKSDDKPIKKSD
jgi:hypothetical protein